LFAGLVPCGIAGATSRGQEVRDADPPAMVDVQPGNVVNVVLLRGRERDELAAELAAALTDAAGTARVVAARMRGVPLSSNELTGRQLNQIRDALGRGRRRPTESEAEAAYDFAVASLLERILRRAGNSGEFAVYGLPVEPLDASRRAIREVNARFASVMDRLDVVVSAASFTVGDGEDEWSVARSGLSEALRLRGERRVMFRSNGNWREAFVPDPELRLADVNVAWVNNRIEVRDAETDEVILSPRAQPLHVVGDSGAIVPVISMQPVHGGFDLLYRFTNDSAEARPLGIISVGIFTLGEEIVANNFRRDGADVRCDFSREPDFVGPMTYPQMTYSPVGVIRNDRYAIGISLHYPILEYKHDVNWRLWSPTNGSNGTGEGGRGWAMWFKLSNMGTERQGTGLRYSAMLEPGSQREYRVCVRVADHPDDWMRTLLPYREYFHELYGPVQYERDDRPVALVAAAGEWEITEDNRYGFLPQHGRPDRDGFGPFAAKMRSLRRDWDRIMIWKPSGVYQNHDDVGLPYQFTTNWLTGDEDGHAMGDAIEQLSTVPGPDFHMGLWWGHAAVVMTEWNPQPEHIEPFDPDNPDHRQRALAEIDLAAAAGATMVGLDNYMHVNTPQWKLYDWLRVMQERHPQIRFIGETRQPDFMHQIAPTFIRATRKDLDEPVDRLEDTYQITAPTYLADFLMPGHEIWALISSEDLSWYYGRDPSDDELRYEVHRLAAMGYNSVVSFTIVPDRRSNAAESWLTSVPADLRLEVGESP